jgi:hypothetical protein
MKSWSPSAWLLVLVSVLAIVPVFAGRIPGKLVVSDLDNCYEGKQPVKFTIASHFESAVQVNVVVEAKFTEGWREVESSLTAPSKTKLVALKPLKVGETLAVSFTAWPTEPARLDASDTFRFRVDILANKKWLPPVWSSEFVSPYGGRQCPPK